MNRYLIVQITDILENPMVNANFGEYKSLNEAKANKPDHPSMPKTQYVVIRKSGVDSNGSAKSVKIVHLF